MKRCDIHKFHFQHSGPGSKPAGAAPGRAAATIRIFPAPLPGGAGLGLALSLALNLLDGFSGLVSAAVRQDRDPGSPCGSRTDLCKNK